MMRKVQKLVSVLLSVSLLLAFAGCANTQEPSAADQQDSEAVDVQQEEPQSEEPQDELDEDGAWQLEPAYGKPVKYYIEDGCSSGPVVADLLGFYEEVGLTAEGVKGSALTEALGTGAAVVGIPHIATLLVPITNGVGVTFVGGVHFGCKSLYVLADSEYETTQDLVGQRISVPNGIGNSDYNITACLLDSDGINPIEDVDLVQVETSACVVSMQNGEIAAALLSDNWAYDMVKDGTLRPVRSLLDEDWATRPCCVIGMNTAFIEENPITARKVTEAIQKAHGWMRENPEEAVQMMLDEGLYSGETEKLLEFHNSLQFRVDNDTTQDALRYLSDAYVRLGLVTATDDVEDIMTKAWTPLLPE